VPDPAIRVVAAEDDPLAQRAITAYVAGAPDIALVGVCGDGAEALDLVTRLSPDVLLTDIQMPGLDGVELVRRALSLPRPPRALCFTSLGEEETMRAALEAGAAGFLLKVDPPELLVHAIRCVHAGESLVSPKLLAAVLRSFTTRSEPPAHLSGIEVDLVRLVGEGRDNAEISAALCLAPSTVKTYLSRLLRRTDSRSRAQLAARAYQWGLVR
jgi:DNA-binding NarL/FixJ family response regulator